MRPISIFLFLMISTLCVSAGVYLIRRPVPPSAGKTGAELMAFRECALCHAPEPDTPESMIHDPARNCAACHQREGIAWFQAPMLSRVGQKLRREWMKEFLLRPHDVRPYFHEEMPDFDFSKEEAAAIADHLIASAPEAGFAPNPAAAERIADAAKHEALLAAGRDAYAARACQQCHEYSGVLPMAATEVNATLRTEDMRFFAPDLRFTRDRLRPEWIPGYLRHADKYDPLLRMPSYPDMDDEEAVAITYFLLHESLNDVTPRAEAFQPVSDVSFQNDVLPVLEIYCAFACHYPHESQQMGWGTGFAGGFGYPRRELDLTSYKGLMTGSLDEHGNRRPMVIPGDINSPLLQRLRGEVKPAMPMGIKMPESARQILEQWILEGAPGPSGN